MSGTKDANVTEQLRSLGALLRLPYEALQAYTYGELARGGFPEIRPAHSSVFRHILPGGSRVTELAERASMTKQSMGYLVDDLHHLGFVSQIADPEDGRAKRVKLTSRGVAFQKAALIISRRFEDKFRELLGTADARKLRNLLERVVDGLDSLK